MIIYRVLICWHGYILLFRKWVLTGSVGIYFIVNLLMGTSVHNRARAGSRSLDRVALVCMLYVCLSVTFYDQYTVEYVSSAHPPRHAKVTAQGSKAV